MKMDEPSGIATSIKVAAIVGALAGTWNALFPSGHGTPVGRLSDLLYGYWSIALALAALALLLSQRVSTALAGRLVAVVAAFWIAFLVAAVAVIVFAYAIFPAGH
jgi:hypothetical protein